MRWPGLLLLFVFLAGARAAEPLTVQVNTGDLRLRHDSPIPLEVRLDNHTPGLRTGWLEATILHRDRRVGVLRSPELVLSPGPRVVPLLVPPITGVEAGDGLAVRLRFVGAEGALELGDHRLGSLNLGGKEFVQAIARTDRRMTKLEIERERSLRLERLHPEKTDSLYLGFSTVTTSLAAERLPTQPIGWCAYDMAVIDGPAFLTMNEKQLTALARWIEGGGSAAIFAELPLADRHLAFLRQLAEDDGVPLGLDDQSRLELPRPGPLRLAPGLGRAVVTNQIVGEEKDLNKAPWRGATAWLWKLTAREQKQVDATGAWSKDWERSREEDIGNWNLDADSPLGTWLRTGAMGFDSLAPDRPRPLPLGVVAGLLGALLFIAGPVDWFCLGWLRRRRWTWIFFSLLCLFTTWLATQFAARYIGRQGRTGVVRIIDLGPNNRPLRETRIELSMPADDVEWRTEVTDGVTVPLQRLDALDSEVDPATGVALSAPMTFSSGRWRAATPAQRSNEPPEWAGEWAGAGHYIHRQNVRQWTPAWRQSLSFPTQPDAGGPDWTKYIETEPPAGERMLPTAPGEQWQYLRIAPNQVSSRKGSSVRRNYPAGPQLRDSWDIRARELFSASTGPTAGLVADEAPAPASDTLANVQLTHPLGIIAWRMAGHELLIYRRHVSQRELDAKP